MSDALRRRKNWRYVDQAVNLVLAGCALFAVALLAKREFFPTNTSGGSPGLVARELRPEQWSAVLDAALPGAVRRPDIAVVEFIDVECPFCAAYAPTLDSLEARYHPRVEVALAHLPLSQHRFARIGAHALECARAQGRIKPLLNVLLRGQDSIGIKSWSDFARDAGVRDLDAFEACRGDTTVTAPVRSGEMIASTIGVRGTPGIAINGWIFEAPPSEQHLSVILESVLNGKSALEALRLAGAQVILLSESDR